ncbi:hypothetical protein [Anaerorhabdus sp.]|uniref:hypothetical protein n=1 Tax=Anaerorhabdus sp. TaxID=1872524 RepID=UPI002FC6D8D7
MVRIEIYALKEKFIDDAYHETNGLFMLKQRPYVLGVQCDGVDYLIPLSHGGDSDRYSYALKTQNLRFSKAFPLVNRSIIQSSYYRSALDSGTFDELNNNFDKIVASFRDYIQYNYPSKYSFDHRILLELQRNNKY